MELMQSAAIFILSIVNSIVLIVLAASRADVSFWKVSAAQEKEKRDKYQDKINLLEEKLSKQNRLIRAMSISNGFEDPTDGDDDDE